MTTAFTPATGLLAALDLLQVSSRAARCCTCA